jgi:hypothetical protein
MAYAFADPAAHGDSHPHSVRSHRALQRPDDALDSARGIIAWALLAALMFWLPLGIVLSR